MDNAMTPVEKLEYMIESFKTIVYILSLTSHKEESAGAEDTLPLLIYVILKAAPSRLVSNIKYNKKTYFWPNMGGRLIFSFFFKLHTGFSFWEENAFASWIHVYSY